MNGGGWGSLRSSRRVVYRLLAPLFRGGGPQRREITLHHVEADQHGALRALLEAIARRPKLTVTLTFDDGFRSSMEAIRRLPRVRAVFFVCPGYLEAPAGPARQRFLYRNLLEQKTVPPGPAPACLAPLDWEDIRVLHREGHVIGAHTRSHRHLSELRSRRELEREIVGAGDLLEDRLNAPVEWFAHPFGDARSIHADACRIAAARYRHLCTGIRGNNHGREGRFLHWRDAVELQWPTEYILFLLSGGLDWAYRRQRRRMRAMAGADNRRRRAAVDSR